MAKAKQSTKEIISELGKKTRFKSGEKQVETSRKGGLASQKVQHEKREFKSVFETILASNTPEAIAKQLKDAGQTDTRYYTAIGVALVKKAMEGDVSAFNSIRDTIGEKPVENKNISVEANVETSKLDGILDQLK